MSALLHAELAGTSMSFANRLLAIRRALQTERKPLPYPELEALILARRG